MGKLKTYMIKNIKEIGEIIFGFYPGIFIPF
jgi:hypothetical protein